MLQPDGQDDGHTLSGEPLFVFIGLSSVLLFAWLPIVSFLFLNWNFSQLTWQPRHLWKYKSILWLPSKNANTKTLLAGCNQDKRLLFAAEPRHSVSAAAVKRKVLHVFSSETQLPFFYICIEWPFLNTALWPRLAEESSENPNRKLLFHLVV